ncbi:hypothetical protein CHUAL_006736 [Chamberlinius hualienensis]
MDLLEIVSTTNWLLIAVIILVTVLLYIYGTWNHGFWESQNVTTVPSYPLIGSIEGAALLENVGPKDLENSKKYGKVYGFYEGRKPYLMISDLDMIKAILVKDFDHFVDRRKMPLGGKSRLAKPFLTNLTGDEWKSARAVLSPTFTSGKLRQMFCLMEESAMKMTASVYDDIKKYNGVVNVKDRIGVFTMDVIASCCFGTNINIQDPNDTFIQHAKMLFNRDFGLPTFLMIVAPRLVELLEISIFPAKCLSYFEKVVKTVLGHRRLGKTKRNDFLQLLLDAQEKENDDKIVNGHEKNQSYSTTENDSAAWKQHKVLDENGLVANSILFLLAGFDTTASAISFTIYSMALNPECQQTLMEEIDQAIEKHGKLATDVILALPYLEMVLSETLRMYPPALRLERLCTKDYKYGDIFIRKGCMVAAAVYSIHHDPDIYPEPNKFDPDRFSYENKSQRHPMAYIPFGVGPRICIGMRFALMEAKICLAYFFKTFKVSKCDKTEVSTNITSSVALG